MRVLTIALASLGKKWIATVAREFGASEPDDGATVKMSEDSRFHSIG